MTPTPASSTSPTAARRGGRAEGAGQPLQPGVVEALGGGRERAAPGDWALILLGLALTLLPGLLPQPSLWFDEALSVSDAWSPRGLNHNGSWFQALRAVTEALGGRLDEFGLRALSLGSSFATAVLLLLAGSSMAGPQVAAWTVLCWGASPWALHWAGNARPYAAGAAVVALGLVVWLRAARQQRPLGALFGLALMGLAGALQLTFLVVPAGLVLATLAPARLTGWEAGRLRRTTLVGSAVGALAVGPWGWSTLRVYLAQKQEISGLDGVLHFVTSAGYHLSPALGIAAVAGALRLRGHGPLAALGPACAVGAGAVGLVSFAGQTTAQYVFGLLPLCCLLAGASAGSSGRAAWAVRGLLVLGLGLGTFLELGPQRGSRSPWREAFAYVERHRGPDEAVLAMQAGLGDLYTRPGWVDARYPRALAPLDRTRPHDLAALARSDRDAWIVLRPDFLLKWPADERARLEETLRLHGTREARFDAPAPGRDLALEVYRLRLGGS